MRTALPAAVVLVLALAGCSNPPEQPSAAASSPPPAGPAVVPRGTNGEQACAEIKRANALHGVDDPQLDTLAAVGYAATLSGSASIAIPGQLLVDAGRLAQAAAGQESEWRLRLGAATRAIELETACITAGYYPPPG